MGTSGIRWLQESGSDAFGEHAADLVAAQLQEKPNATLVFPTGNTPLPMYQALRHRPALRWHSARLFHLDEYVKPSALADTPRRYESYADYMRRELWDYVDGEKFFLRDHEKNPLAYESLIEANGGIDLAILGIGRNGHIAFNEPGSFPDSSTRLVNLSETTRISNFGASNRPGYPTQAITLGLRLLLQARHILLLATGDSKKEILHRALDPANPPSAACPASWLQTCPRLTVLTDFAVGV